MKLYDTDNVGVAVNAYKKIVGMGNKAIPLLINKISHEPIQEYEVYYHVTALVEITKDTNSSYKYLNDSSKVKYWIAWWKKKHLNY